MSRSFCSLAVGEWGVFHPAPTPIGIRGALASVGISSPLGANIETVLSLAPKSMITPITMGLNAHEIGSARAFQVSSEIGAFSGLGMALMAFSGPILMPWLLSLFGVG